MSLSKTTLRQYNNDSDWHETHAQLQRVQKKPADAPGSGNNSNEIPNTAQGTTSMEIADVSETAAGVQEVEKNDPLFQPFPGDDKKREKYEAFLVEGVDKLLKIGFGSPGGTSYEKTDDDKYNSEYWQLSVDGQNGSATLILKTGVKPSVAISDIFDHPDKWNADCARFIQLAHFYALLHTMTAEEFDKTYGDQPFFFRTHDSTGITPGINFCRLVPGEAFRRDNLITGPVEKRTEQELLDVIPVGSRVGFKVFGFTVEENVYAFENTVKVGPDLYGAHGFGKEKNKFTRAEIENELGKMFYPKPEDMDEVTYENNLKQFIEDNIFISEIQALNKDAFKDK